MYETGKKMGLYAFACDFTCRLHERRTDKHRNDGSHNRGGATIDRDRKQRGCFRNFLYQ